mmetsp:Transcript_45536/g.131922  ORF Transcript_45536/g.131922 Transcript_45536/m.131922 type:complete len:268 (-) Transcript_45536:71-874(-)
MTAPPAKRRCIVEGISLELAEDDGTSREGCEDVTGFELWRPATAAACRALSADTSLVRRRLVLELGCGLGALGAFCSHLGAAGVLLTDREPAVLRLAARTAALSGASARCDFVAVNFAKGKTPWRSGVFDLAVASDVLFLDSLARPLLGAFQALHGDQAPRPAAPRERPLAAVLGHEVRRAVYRGADGQPRLEAADSALEEFLELAGPHARRIAPEGSHASSPEGGTARSDDAADGGPCGDERRAASAPAEPEVATVLLRWPAPPTA